MIRGTAFAVAGACALWISVTLGLDATAYRARATRTHGTVISLYSGPSHPKIEFLDAKGRLKEFYGGGWISHHVGDRVDVIYDEHDPNRAPQLDELGARWFMPGMFGVLGAAAFVVGVFVALRRSR